MRILLVADFYRHGVARVVEDRAAALVGRGHRVALLAGTEPERIDLERREAERLGLEPHLLPYAPAGGGPREFLRLSRAFRRAFEERAPARGFDAIVFNQPLSARAVLRSPAARRSATLYTFHSPWALEWAIARGLLPPGGAPALRGLGARAGFAARRWIEERVLHACDRVTLLSDFMRSQLLAAHPRVPPRKVALIPGGVDLTRFRPSDPGARRARKAALGLPPDAPLLLTLRRLVPRMGLEVLLRAFRLLASRFPDLELAIGGSGPLEAELRSLARTLGIAGRVRFLGYVADSALPGLYAAADLFVLPTTQLEGFGLVTVEALASGTPVVGTPVGATPEILKGLDSRLLARAPTPGSLEEAVARILELPAGERRALGALARRRMAAFYDGAKVGEALERLLAGMVRARGPGGDREARAEAAGRRKFVREREAAIQ